MRTANGFDPRQPGQNRSGRTRVTTR